MTTTALLPLSASWVPILPTFSPAKLSYHYARVVTAIAPVPVVSAVVVLSSSVEIASATAAVLVARSVS
jgi:hypothetical protein